LSTVFSSSKIESERFPDNPPSIPPAASRIQRGGGPDIAQFGLNRNLRTTLSSSTHRFHRHPHRTLLGLAGAVLVSLIAEPLTGLVDTHFVAQLGESSSAALGVATTLLSSAFWIFGFLGVGTQTEVASSDGAGDRAAVRRHANGALVLAVLLAGVCAAGIWLALDPIVSWMRAEGEVATSASDYIRVRLLAAPAVLVSFAAFGALRGLQDMKTPLWIALAINAINIALDPLFIFGAGPISPMGVTGAAWASVISQWIGALWAAIAVYRRVGFEAGLSLRAAVRLLLVGRDLFVRVACLNFFLILLTRAATEIGTEAGAAHQAIRQAWFFAALFLDAFATSAQSLVAYFLGANDVASTRRVAAMTVCWSFVCGIALAAFMILFRGPSANELVPDGAHAVFWAGWIACALSQPIAGVSFATDGIHWGTGDFAYLRNGVVLATAIGIGLLSLVDLEADGALRRVWIANGIWISIRAVYGVVRIWPGVGKAPLRPEGRATGLAEGSVVP